MLKTTQSASPRQSYLMMHVTMLPLLQQQEICLKSALTKVYTTVSEGHIACKDCLIEQM